MQDGTKENMPKSLESCKPVVRDLEGNIMGDVDISISHTTKIATAIAIYVK